MKFDDWSILMIDDQVNWTRCYLLCCFKSMSEELNIMEWNQCGKMKDSCSVHWCYAGKEMRGLRIKQDTGVGREFKFIKKMNWTCLVTTGPHYITFPNPIQVKPSYTIIYVCLQQTRFTQYTSKHNPFRHTI